MTGRPGSGRGEILEGPDARTEVGRHRRRTESRTLLARDARFRELSPGVGELDEEAFGRAFTDDADQALATLARARGSSDRELRELARRLAGRVVVDLARGEHTPRRGIDRLRARRGETEGDLDLEASLDAVLDSRALGSPPDLDRLVTRSWVKADHALSLVVDRSGSMGGERLVAAALAAAVVACRAPADYSVIAVARDAVVVKRQDEARPVEEVIDEVLALRGHGTTNLELGLRTAARELARAQSGRRIAVLLSDGNATAGGDPLPAARALDTLHVVAPPGECDAAAELARHGGGRLVELSGPAQVPAALLRLMR